MPVVEFLAQIKADIRQDAPLAQGRLAHSVFFGGGTPSLLPADAIGEIIDCLKTTIGLTPDAEVTLEANPGTFEAEKFRAYRAVGVNRLSIGVQSFNDVHLARLGRIHSAQNAIDAIEQAKAVGFENFNIDLMHGLPEQSLEDALADLTQAVDLKATHISWYQLTIEQNTEFYQAPPPLPNDDTLWNIQEAGQALLAKRGFTQYEVSAYSQPNQESQHNLNYWRYGDYLGVGPGAHGKITHLSHPLNITRTRKTRLPKDYLNDQRPLVRHEETVELSARPFDYFMNRLRLREPVPLAEFTERTGCQLSHILKAMANLEAKQYLTITPGHLQTTEMGYLYLNDLLMEWLP